MAVFTSIISCVDTASAGKEKHETESTSTVKAVADDIIQSRMTLKFKGRYDEVVMYAEGFITVLNDGKYGLTDTAGKELIAPSVSNMCVFVNGFAVLEEGSTIRVIDKSGTVLFPPHSDWEQVAVEDSGLLFVQTKRGRYGYVSMEGKTMIPFDYTGADFSMFRQGVAIMQKGDKAGLIDRHNNLIAPFVYSEINAFDDSRYTTVKKGGKWGIMRNDGVLVHPVTMPYVEAESFSNGLSRVKKGNLNGYIDTTGKEVIALQYPFAAEFNEWGMAQVSDYEQTWLINTNGDAFLKGGHLSVEQQGYNLFLIKSKETGRLTVTDKSGSALWPGVYDSIDPIGRGQFLVKQQHAAQWFVDSTGAKLENYVSE